MSTDSNLFLDQSSETTLPLYEAKLIHQYTHRWATYQDAETQDFSLTELQNPNTTITPRYWVEQSHVQNKLSEKQWKYQWLLGFRDITNATNERTAIFSILPTSGVGNNLPLLFFTNKTSSQLISFLACTNSLIFDAVTRPKVGGTHLNFFIVKQLPVLPPETFGAAELSFIVPRVLELVYTAYDLQAFGNDVWNEANGELRDRIRQQRLANHAATKTIASAEIDQAVANINLFRPDQVPPFIWDEQRRARIRAELDALIAKLYGLDRDELRYILDPSDVYGEDFPGETFRVLKNREIKEYGEYRTQRLVLAAWDRLAELNWDLSKYPIE